MTDILEHVDYPHEAGRLVDCAACESTCYCTGEEGDEPCVHCGQQDIPPYVESWEYVTSNDSDIENNWLRIYCVAGDEYSAWFEDGAWWLPFIPGEPSQGPFESGDAVIEWLNTEQ